MNILNVNDIEAYSYVVLPNDFEIIDESQIIFAPNGTGKTTLFKILINQNKNNCDVYTYDESMEPTYKVVDGKKRKLEINPLSSNFIREEDKKNLEAVNLNVKDIIQTVYPGKTTLQMKKAATDDEVREVITTNICKVYAPLRDEDRKKLEYILPYFDDLRKIILGRECLKSLSEEQKKSDLEMLKFIDRRRIYDCYSIDKHKSDIFENGCPLCGRNDEKVYEDMLNIREEVQKKKFAFFENFEFLDKLPKSTDSLEVINNIIDGVLSLTEKQLIFLLLSKGDLENEKYLEKSIENYKCAEDNLKKYITERDDAYNKMLSSRDTIEKYFPTFYPNSTIKFDEKNKTIIVNTPRNMTTYSEGEKHEIYSTIRELAILGSDKKLVIADDPLTELDVANEYKNVFRFVNLAYEKKKKVIIFTCNPNFINIANEYHSKIFKRYYLTSKYNTIEDHIELKLLEMNFQNNNGQGPYISLKQAVGTNLDKINNQVVSLIFKRATLELSKLDDTRLNAISRVLHYDSSSSIDVDETHIIKNDMLVDLIENFEGLPNYSDFTELARDRICYLAALRVFIEKKIFDYQQSRISKGLVDCFSNRTRPYLTKEKIRIVDEQDDYKITEMYKNWNRSSLMCLKTMLNDNDHPYSQILPLSYAISIGNDTLEYEIKAIKDIFK